MTRGDLDDSMKVARGVAERLRLPPGAQAWKGQAGEFQGAGIGSSIDFQDHRDYAPGDDPRHINWQAYARTGQYSMKLYREEVRPVVDLFVDVSESMWVEVVKGKRTCELLYFFALSAERSGASLQVTLVKGGDVRVVSLESILSHRWFEEAEGMNGDSGPQPQLVRAGARANAIRILLSDLLYEGEPGPVLRMLHERQGTGLIFAPFTRQEADPGWRGHFDFVDAEQKTRHPHQIGAAVLERYLEAYHRHFGFWVEEARRYQVALVRVDSEADLFKSLNDGAVRSGALEVLP